MYKKLRVYSLFFLSFFLVGCVNASASEEAKNRDYAKQYGYFINPIYQTIIEEYYKQHYEDLVEYVAMMKNTYNALFSSVDINNLSPKSLGVFSSHGQYEGTYIVELYYHTVPYNHVKQVKGPSDFCGAFTYSYQDESGNKQYIPNLRIFDTILVAYNNHCFYTVEDAINQKLINSTNAPFLYVGDFGGQYTINDLNIYAMGYKPSNNDLHKTLAEYISKERNKTISVDEVIICCNWDNTIMLIDSPVAGINYGVQYSSMVQIPLQSGGYYSLSIPTNYEPFIQVKVPYGEALYKSIEVLTISNAIEKYNIAFSYEQCLRFQQGIQFTLEGTLGNWENVDITIFVRSL